MSFPGHGPIYPEPELLFLSPHAPPQVPSGPQPPNHYVLLQVSAWASPRQIRRAYHDLFRCFHPNLFPLEEQDDAYGACKRLRSAYHTLNNPYKRREYDQQIGFQRPSEFYFPLPKPRKTYGHGRAESSSQAAVRAEEEQQMKEERKRYKERLWNWKFSSCPRPHRHFCTKEEQHSECGCDSNNSSSESDSSNSSNFLYEELDVEKYCPRIPEYVEGAETQGTRSPKKIPLPAGSIMFWRRHVRGAWRADDDDSLGSIDHYEKAEDLESADADDEFEETLSEATSTEESDEEVGDKDIDGFDEEHLPLRRERFGGRLNSRRAQPPPGSQFRSRWSSSEEEDKDDEEENAIKADDYVDVFPVEQTESSEKKIRDESLEGGSSRNFLAMSELEPPGYPFAQTNREQYEPTSSSESEGGVRLWSGDDEAPPSDELLAAFRSIHGLAPALNPVGDQTPHELAPAVAINRDEPFAELPAAFRSIDSMGPAPGSELCEEVSEPTESNEEEHLLTSKLQIKLPKARELRPLPASQEGCLVPVREGVGACMHNPLQQGRSDSFCSVHRPNCRKRIADDVLRAIRLREQPIFEEESVQHNYIRQFKPFRNTQDIQDVGSGASDEVEQVMDEPTDIEDSEDENCFLQEKRE